MPSGSIEDEADGPSERPVEFEPTLDWCRLGASLDNLPGPLQTSIRHVCRARIQGTYAKGSLQVAALAPEGCVLGYRGQNAESDTRSTIRSSPCVLTKFRKARLPNESRPFACDCPAIDEEPLREKSTSGCSESESERARRLAS